MSVQVDAAHAREQNYYRHQIVTAQDFGEVRSRRTPFSVSVLRTALSRGGFGRGARYTAGSASQCRAG